MDDYITESRLLSVLSKLPDDQKTYTKKNISILISKLNNDAVDDFILDNDLQVNNTLKNHVIKKIGSSSYKVINSYFNS